MKQKSLSTVFEVIEIAFYDLQSIFANIFSFDIIGIISILLKGTYVPISMICQIHKPRI